MAAMLLLALPMISPAHALESDSGGTVLDRPPGSTQPGADQGEPQAQGRDAITVMFDSFFLSLVAASLCSTPDDAVMQKFATNLLIVQQLTFSHYEEYMPTLSRDEILGIMNDRAMALDTTIKNQISQKKCDHADIQRFVELFDLHAKMDLLPQQ